MKPLNAFSLPFLLSIFGAATFSCQQGGMNCAAVLCLTGGDPLELEFVQDGENILDQNPSAKIVVLQNGDTTDFTTDAAKKTATVFLQENAPLTVLIEQSAFQIDVSATYTREECCSGIQVNQLSLGDRILCEGESCNQTIAVAVD